jgi:hypothetical protein
MLVSHWQDFLLGFAKDRLYQPLLLAALQELHHMFTAAVETIDDNILTKGVSGYVNH